MQQMPIELSLAMTESYEFWEAGGDHEGSHALFDLGVCLLITGHGTETSSVSALRLSLLSSNTRSVLFSHGPGDRPGTLLRALQRLRHSLPEAACGGAVTGPCY